MEEKIHDKCPNCGSFKIIKYPFNSNTSIGKVERCLDCGWDFTVEAEGKGGKDNSNPF